jgi:hypothetical protein
MLIWRIALPKPLARGPGAITRVWPSVSRLALAWWVRRLERQLEQFSSPHTLFNCPRQPQRGRQRSAQGMARANAKWTLCGAFCP